MAKNRYYHYFVEGQDEEKVVQVLKTDLRCIVPGKVQVFNVIEQKLTKMRLMSLKPDTVVVLVFDTDTGKTATLLDNIRFLKTAANVKEVLCVTQVKNLEDELMRSCDIKQIRELTGSRSNKDYKHDMRGDSHFYQKLKNRNFRFEAFWNSTDKNFQEKGIRNDAYKIKCDKI